VTVSVAAQREGIISFVGTEIKEGEKVPADQKISKQYRRVRKGDHVEAGQLLGRVDDRLARDEMTIKEQKLSAAKADLVVSEKTRDEAKERFATQTELYKRKATSLEEFRGAQLAVDKYTSEVASKQAAIAVAEAELNQARTVVEMHNIRSPVRGVIRTIYIHPGEGVQSLGLVFVIELEK